MSGDVSPILAIAIPTYNRQKLLGILLDSISRDFDSWPPDLEIVILDNASPDSTADEVLKRIDQGFPARLIVNECNVGMDANLAAGFDVTKAKYLWQIGDDEVLHKGACRFVLEFCRRNEFGLLHMECTGFSDGEQSREFARHLPQEVKVQQMDSAEIYRSANVLLTFISANVVNRHLIKARFPNFDPKSETNSFLPQLAWIYGALKVSNRHFHLRTPILGALGGNTGGYRLVEVFGVNLLSITERQLGPIIPGATRMMANAVLTRVFPVQLLALSRIGSAGNRFESEDLDTALKQVFGKTTYLALVVRLLLSRFALVRVGAYCGLRAYDKVNRWIKYRWL